MDALSLVLAGALTLALAAFALGLAHRVGVWVRTPSPLPIPLAPAPRTRVGVLGRLVLELFAFRSLARASLATWVPAVLLHYGLLLVLVVHLRFLFPALPLWLVPFLRIGGWATLALVAGLAALLARRVLVDRVRYVSVPSDYLHLALLLAIAASGAALKRLWPVDLYPVGAFLRGVLALDWQPLPAHAGLVVHLVLVLALLAVFPISKLVHAPGIAFAPTFHQRDPQTALGSREGGRASPDGTRRSRHAARGSRDAARGSRGGAGGSRREARGSRDGEA